MPKNLLTMLLVAGLISACGGGGDVSGETTIDAGQTNIESTDSGENPETEEGQAPTLQSHRMMAVTARRMTSLQTKNQRRGKTVVWPEAT